MKDSYMDEYSKRIGAIHAKIEEALGDDERIVYYSAYRSDSKDLPINNLNRVAVKGKVVFVAEHNDFWGEGESYESEVVENPTWLQVAVLANAMMKTTGDLHHSFLEGIYRKKVRDDGVTVCRIATGS